MKIEKRVLSLALAFLLCMSLAPGAIAMDTEEPETGVIERISMTGGESPVGEAGPETETPDDSSEPAEAEPAESQVPRVSSEIQGTIVDTGISGDTLSWTLDDEGNLIISGTGPIDGSSYGWDTWSVHQREIRCIVIESGITAIGERVFQAYPNLEEVRLPDTLSSLGDRAFFACPELRAIVAAAGNPVFKSVDGVLFSADGTKLLLCPAGLEGSYSIPAGVTEIGPWAFCFCEKLTEVMIPEGVAKIREWAFNGCSGITSLTLPNTVTVLENHWMYGTGIRTLELPESIIEIGDLTFEFNSDLTEVMIPDSVTRIGNGAFLECGLTSVRIPGSVSTIGEDAFGECGELREVILCDGVSTICAGAFAGCINLTSICLPKSVSQINNMGSEGADATGSGTFAYCEKLTEILADENNPMYRSVDGVLYSKDGTELAAYPGGRTGAFTIPDGVTRIGVLAFEGCLLNSVQFPPQLSSIENDAFRYSRSLSEITFTGPAPAMGETCFLSVTATAYYPAGDASWTEEVRQSYGGTITWVPYSCLRITEQPQDQTVAVGETARFHVAVQGEEASYQWQYRIPGASEWKGVSAASGKTDTYVLKAASRHDGYQYRCVVSDPTGSVTSETAVLTVMEKPVITVQPGNVSVRVGEQAVFSVTAQGRDLRYQWQYQTPGTDGWKAVSAASGKTASYALKAASRHDGYRYRCVITNGAGSVTSEIAVLTIDRGPYVKTQPKSQTVRPGEKASFTVTAGGEDLHYQWYYKIPGSSSWKAVSAASGKTASYVLTAAARHDGYRYRCKVSNSYGSVTSKTVTLTVDSLPYVKSQPKSQTVNAGEKASFTITAGGDGLSYQWYYQIPGSEAWKAVSAASGKTASYSLTAAARHDGYQYRCTVTNEYGSVTSETVTLTVKIAG